MEEEEEEEEAVAHLELNEVKFQKKRKRKRSQSGEQCMVNGSNSYSFTAIRPAVNFMLPSHLQLLMCAEEMLGC